MSNFYFFLYTSPLTLGHFTFEAFARHSYNKLWQKSFHPKKLPWPKSLDFLRKPATAMSNFYLALLLCIYIWFWVVRMLHAFSKPSAYIIIYIQNVKHILLHLMLMSILEDYCFFFFNNNIIIYYICYYRVIIVILLLWLYISPWSGSKTVAK